MSRPIILNALDAGIDRQLPNGGANPRALWDLVNGFINLRGKAVSRDGTENDANLPTAGATVGLCAFGGELVVFSHEAQTVPSGYRCEILTHPTDPGATLAWIHFAFAFAGYLYVGAEWSDGAVFHYWLRSADTWQADTIYFEGDLVQPSALNGFVYRAHRVSAPNPVWAPSVARTEDDVIEPTVPSGYQHTCVSALGANPRSGTTEPVWATGDGNLTIEDADSSTSPGTAPSVDPVVTSPIGDPERYRARRGAIDP